MDTALANATYTRRVANVAAKVETPMPGDDKRWWALIVLSAGVLMIMVDTMIVPVALPSIRQDLSFTDSSLTWVVNAYTLTFGGFLMLGGRLGDLYGGRRVFLLGIALFTIASLLCGLVNTGTLLIAARAVQGLGAAAILAVAISLIANMFPDPVERARAMGIYGFSIASGAAMGPLLGGVLTSALGWHWVFLVNVPVGVLIYVLGRSLLAGSHEGPAFAGRLGTLGTVALTISLGLTIYAVVDAKQVGWFSAQTLSVLIAAVISGAAFVILESRSSTPLVPLSTFRRSSITFSSITRALWAAGVSPWLFLSPLYLQHVLGYEPLAAGLPFFLTNLVTAVFLLGLSARLVMRFGLRKPVVAGMLLSAVGLALLARAPVDGSMIADVLPAAALLGLSAGVANSPLVLAALRDAGVSESGLASGIYTTAATLGGAFGLAVLVSLSAARTRDLLAAGAALPAALTSGYHAAFLLGAVFTGIAALLATLSLPASSRVDRSERSRIGLGTNLN